MTVVNKIQPTNPRISSLLGDVARGAIKIPVFQRDYIWKDEQIMGLLDSIYKGFPVGSLLLWSTKERLTNDRNVGGFRLPDTQEDYPVNYILDGQQRLTTLYGVFNSGDESTDPELAARFNVCFVPSTGDFVHATAADSQPSINLRVLLDTTKLLPELPRFNQQEQVAIAQLVERFKDYEFPVVTIRDRLNQEVCRIFQRINSSGTELSTLELLAAWTWSEQFDLRDKIKLILERLSEKGYDSLQKAEVMRCLTALVSGEVDADLLVTMDPEVVLEAANSLQQAMFSAIDFLEKDIKIKNSVFLPFPIMLVPLVYFFSKTPKPSAMQRTSLRRWFWHCAFTQRYKAGTNRYVKDDIEKMSRLAAGENVFENLSVGDISDLFTKTWRINSTIAKAAICLLSQLNPKSFLSGAEVDLSSSLSAYNARQFHHIYPKAFLSGLGIGFHEANVIANIAMITASDNNDISDDDPKDYFRRIPDEKRSTIFDRALIQANFRDGSLPYKDFLIQRSKDLGKVASLLVLHGELPPNSVPGVA